MLKRLRLKSRDPLNSDMIYIWARSEEICSRWLNVYHYIRYQRTALYVLYVATLENMPRQCSKIKFTRCRYCSIDFAAGLNSDKLNIRRGCVRFYRTSGGHGIRGNRVRTNLRSCRFLRWISVETIVLPNRVRHAKDGNANRREQNCGGLLPRDAICYQRRNFGNFRK